MIAIAYGVSIVALTVAAVKLFGASGAWLRGKPTWGLIARIAGCLVGLVVALLATFFFLSIPMLAVEVLGMPKSVVLETSTKHLASLPVMNAMSTGFFAMMVAYVPRSLSGLWRLLLARRPANPR